MAELTAALIAAAVAIVGAASSFIVSRFEAKKASAKVEELQRLIDDSGGIYYINCPNCGAKIYLKNTVIKKE